MVCDSLSREYLGISLPRCPARLYRPGGCCPACLGSDGKYWERTRERGVKVCDAERGRFRG